MFCFQKYTRHLLRLTWVLKISSKVWVLKQTQSAMLCSVSHMTSHLCDECMKSTLLVVYHMLESILWLILPICSRTTRCQVVRFGPNTNILRQIVIILLLFLQLIPIPPFWTDGRPNKDEKLSKVPPLSHLPIHGIVQRTFEHVLPCRRTTPLYACEVSAIPVIFTAAPEQKYVIRTSLCTVQWLFHSLYIFFECIPNTRGQEMMQVRQYLRSSSISSTLEPNSASFWPFWKSENSKIYQKQQKNKMVNTIKWKKANTWFKRFKSRPQPLRRKNHRHEKTKNEQNWQKSQKMVKKTSKNSKSRPKHPGPISGKKSQTWKNAKNEEQSTKLTKKSNTCKKRSKTSKIETIKKQKKRKNEKRKKWKKEKNNTRF